MAERVFIDGLATVSDVCYRAMDFLLNALPQLQEQVFFTVANLLNLEVDLVFFDTTFDVLAHRVGDDVLLAEPDIDDGDGDDEECGRGRPRRARGVTARTTGGICPRW
ncbi:MAG TPA: hypothetical protein VHF25_04435 [Nitriliruptorales bacterium]|nr:hypothetical protein [Nitriliruptorales bacterium]